MATPFPDRAARLAASINKAFGESFTFLPFTSSSDVNLPKLPDVSRQQFTAVGAWDGPSKSATPHARGSIQDDVAHNWATSFPSVNVDDASLNWLPTRGDRCVRLFDNSIYEIELVMPDGFGRTLFQLSNRKRN